jgi:riboflavin synthase
MRVGIVEVLGAEEVNNVLEEEFEKEVSTLEIKRVVVPTIDDAALGAKMLVEDSGCEFVCIGYALEDKEKLAVATQMTILRAQYELKKHIFRVIVPHDADIKEYAKAAAKEIVRYFYKPEELQHERSSMKPEAESSFNPFALFG